jgi:hypothetical protein
LPATNVPGGAKAQFGEPLIFVKDPAAHCVQVANPSEEKVPGKQFRHASEVTEFK